MANDKYYGYSPKREKPSKTQGQIYSGAEKSTRKGQVTHGTYANIGNRLDRVNPYEFRKGMDYELTKMGCSRLAESTLEEREKSTEKVLKLTSASSSSNEKLVGLSKLKTGGSLIGLTVIKTLASFDSRLLFESISLSSTLKNKLSIPLKSWLGLYVTVPSLLLIILPLAGAKPFSIK